MLEVGRVRPSPPAPLPTGEGSRIRQGCTGCWVVGRVRPSPQPSPIGRGGPSTGSGCAGGSPSPYPLPSRGRGSFDRLRMHGGGHPLPTLSHLGRGCPFDRFRMRGGLPSPYPLPSRERGSFDRLRTNGMDRIWAVAGYGIAAWLTGSKKWVIILKTPVSRHECIAHMGR